MVFPSHLVFRVLSVGLYSHAALGTTCRIACTIMATVIFATVSSCCNARSLNGAVARQTLPFSLDKALVEQLRDEDAEYGFLFSKPLITWQQLCWVPGV